MSRIFIDRPIFAWVIAIIIMLMGIGAIISLPVAQYPDVAPTQINVRASYPGASAATLESSVTQVLERQLTGIDGLLYFDSSSSSRGSVSISAVFDKGVDPDIAQVQVQNKIQQAISRLPQQVQQQGVTVTKGAPDLLLIVAIYDTTDKSTNYDVSDWLTTNMQDELSRVPGVGDVNVFGASYAMRIWLDPHKLASYQLNPGDVVTAIQNQNTEVAAGEVGGMPQPEGQMLNATVTAQSRLQTPEQFRNIIVKADPNGARVLLGDVARVELGADDYSALIRSNGHPGAGIGVSLEPGANALNTAKLVKAKVEQFAPMMPKGYAYAFANDTSDFIKLSVKEVAKTLMEAILLVVLVMFVFLQSWRATLIPFIAVPVVLLGTFALLYILGFSINTMTLFGLVLATGLLVDDAIVVVENVERLMDENPEMTPREATIVSMGQIQMALVGIALVLTAVFLPMVFFGGSTGVIYRQFSATIVSAMCLSVFIALTLSPAIAANLLKRGHGTVEESWIGRRAPRLAQTVDRGRVRFNTGFERLIAWYVGTVTRVVDRKWLFLLIYAAVCAVLIVMFVRLPTGFLPNRGPGRRDGAVPASGRCNHDPDVQVQRAVEDYFLHGPEKQEREDVVHRCRRRPRRERPEQRPSLSSTSPTTTSARALRTPPMRSSQRASAAFRGLRDAQVFALVPGAIRGLGQSTGFTMELLNSNGMSHAGLRGCARPAARRGVADPKLTSVRLSELPDVASLNINMDQQRIASLGLSTSDVNSTISTAWGGRYVNDFIDRGRVKRVYVQGDAPYRSKPSDIDQWSVRNNQGGMVPFSSFAQTSWQTTPTSLSRFLGYPSLRNLGPGRSGVSSGNCDGRDRRGSPRKFPGVTVAWAGQSYQERLSSGQAPCPLWRVAARHLPVPGGAL